MMNEENTQNRNEEIDLLYFLKPITEGIKKLAEWLLSYVKLLWKRKWIFASIIILLSILIYSLSFLLPRGYKSDAIFVSHNLNASFCSLLINNLDESVNKNENFSFLSNQLKIKESSARSIISLESSAISESLHIDKKDSMVSVFKIILITRNKEAVADIQSGLLNYLENNQYSLNRKDAKINSLKALANDLQLKLISMDSIKTMVNNSIVPRSNGQGIILGEPINPVSVYKAESDFYKELLKSKEELAIIKNVELLQPFLLPDSENFPDKRKWFKMGLLYIFLFSLIVTPFIGSKSQKSQGQ